MDIYFQLERDEGFRSLPYRDTARKLTVGIGWNLEGGMPISEDAARFILRQHVEVFVIDLQNRLPWTRHLSQPRFGVLLNMAYNLGVHGLMTFKKMLYALQMGDIKTVDKEMDDSRWARQVGDRAVRLRQQMREDRWV